MNCTEFSATKGGSLATQKPLWPTSGSLSGRHRHGPGPWRRLSQRSLPRGQPRPRAQPCFGWLGHGVRSGAACHPHGQRRRRLKSYGRAPFVVPDSHGGEPTSALFEETAPAARGGPPPETGARLPGGAAQTPAFGGDHAVVLRQPRAAVHVCPGSRREGPGAETPEVHGREPEGGCPLAVPAPAHAHPGPH